MATLILGKGSLDKNYPLAAAPLTGPAGPSAALFVIPVAPPSGSLTVTTPTEGPLAAGSPAPLALTVAPQRLSATSKPFTELRIYGVQSFDANGVPTGNSAAAWFGMSAKSLPDPIYANPAPPLIVRAAAGQVLDLMNMWVSGTAAAVAAGDAVYYRYS